MWLFVLVVVSTAVLMVAWARVPGGKAPALGSMSERWLAEHRASRF